MLALFIKKTVWFKNFSILNHQRYSIGNQKKSSSNQGRGPIIDFDKISNNKIGNLSSSNINFEEKDKSFDQNNELVKNSESLKEAEVKPEIINKKGLNRYMARIYNVTGISLLGTLTTSYIAMSIPSLVPFFDNFAVGGMILAMAGFYGASKIEPNRFKQIEDNEIIYRTTNPFLRLLVYSAGCAGLGLCATPVFYEISSSFPHIIPAAMGITASLFGGASLAAYAMPKGSLLGYGPVLFSGLFGLIAMNVMGAISSHYLGANAISTLLICGENYVSIALFTVYIAYDTHRAIKFYEKKQADHLGMSIQFLLDILNLILKIAKAMAEAKQKKK